MLALAVLLSLSLATCGKNIVEDPYDHTFLRHRSFKRPDQIRSPDPITSIIDRRENSFVR